MVDWFFLALVAAAQLATGRHRRTHLLLVAPSVEKLPLPKLLPHWLARLRVPDGERMTLVAPAQLSTAWKVQPGI